MAIKLPIYLDNHATTPADPRVVDAMLPYFTEKFGNSASRNHAFGWAAEEAVEIARAQIAKLINASPKEIIFTSGATESNNLAIKGVAEMYREKGNHIITQVTEHKAVLDTCKRLEKYGYEVTYLPVQKDGRINLDDLRKAITPKTILISIMYANNEIGVVQPIQEIGKIAKEKGVFFHVDGVQAAGKIPVDVQRDGIDLLSIYRAQNLRPQRRRRSLCAPQAILASNFPPNRRRRPRARHAFRHPKRHRHHRLRQSLRTLPAGNGRGDRQA